MLVHVAVGLHVVTKDGGRLGIVRQLEPGCIRVEREADGQFWLNVELIEDVRHGEARLTIVDAELEQFIATTAELARTAIVVPAPAVAPTLALNA